MTQFFQGHKENLPAHLFIERQGTEFYCSYTTHGTTDLGGFKAPTTTTKRFVDASNHIVKFGTYEEAFAFMQGK